MSGAGAGARNSIGIVLVSGMTIGTLFTLLVVPSIYILIAKDARRGERAGDGNGNFMIEATTPAAPAKNGGARSWLVAPSVMVPAAIGLAVLLYFGISYVAEIFTHESTDDAFIAGHVVSVAPRVSGQVMAVYVVDNQVVRSNDLLVRIDPADLGLAVGQKATIAESQNDELPHLLRGL